ncbi:MAG TPA: lipid A deacylase LpxR family protein [Stellaceae bacterium]|nr:lipid A deacylase LpxR family protein [Stellaceae bacterium]
MGDAPECPARRAVRLALCAVALLGAAPLARADDSTASQAWRSSILEENDSLYTHTDKHYTQGLRLSALSPPLDSSWANDLFDWAQIFPTVFRPGGTRRIAVFLGQSIFTPTNLDITPPDPHDRPYGGWLYSGASLLQETGNQLENLELDLGVVGPGAFGKEIQNDWHQFIGIHEARGWSSQIQNEPGVVLSYERLWRLPVPFLSSVHDGVENGVDIVPELGGSGGNVFTYGQIGAMLRIGRHLEADYGPVRIRPALSGTDYFNPARLDDEFGFYVFAGAAGRVVAHNIFLDGNSFRHSSSVEHKTFVGDLQAGVSAFWSRRVRLDLSMARRTDEFVGQRRQDIIGTAALAVTW